MDTNTDLRRTELAEVPKCRSMKIKMNLVEKGTEAPGKFYFFS
jgi:hypothetical protein